MSLKSHDLKQTLSKMAVNQHFCSIYDNPEEWADNARSFWLWDQ
jgi:hypothetical protein